MNKLSNGEREALSRIPGDTFYTIKANMDIVAEDFERWIERDGSVEYYWALYYNTCEEELIKRGYYGS